MVDEGKPTPRTCRVFLSYAHESPEHVERVAQLYKLLRNNGVDARADIVASQDRQDWERWTHRQISMADRVLVIASPEYKRRFEGAAAPHIGRGARYEARFIREHLYRDEEAGTRKFIPVLLPGVTMGDIPDALQPTSATHYVISSLTPEGIKPLLRLLTGQPARTEPPLSPIKILPPEEDSPTVELCLLARSIGWTVDDELARQLMNSACQEAEISAVDLGVAANTDGTAAVVPIVSGRDVLGRWIRALHQEIKILNREHPQRHVQARLGLHRLVTEPCDEVTITTAVALANCETVRAMIRVHAAELVIATSDNFHTLVIDGAVRFPSASAYSPLTMDRDGGRRCWIAVAGYSVCPELPPPTPPSGKSNIDNSSAGPFTMRDNFGSVFNTVINQGGKSSIHLGHISGGEDR